MEIDYSKLSRRELEDVAAHIDRSAFPERAALVDTELTRRLASADDAQNPVSRADGRGWFVAGTIIAVIGFLPIFVGTMLDRFGAVEIGTGLGFGLLFWLCGGVAAVLFIVGERRNRPKRVPPN